MHNQSLSNIAEERVKSVLIGWQIPDKRPLLKDVMSKMSNILLSFQKPRVKAVFLNRPQRFLAKVRTSNAADVLAYCANPGSLKGCLESGSPVVLWDSGDLKRKRRYTWRAIKIKKVWVGTDTHLTNRLVEAVLRRELFSSLSGYTSVVREPKISGKKRIDFLLTGPQGKCFIEVKSATVVQNGVAQFPDSITPRSIEQLKILAKKSRQGHRAVLIFVAQRGDAKAFSINGFAYPEYVQAFKFAMKAGVELFAWGFSVSPKGFGMPFSLKILN